MHGYACIKALMMQDAQASWWQDTQASKGIDRFTEKHSYCMS
jgi:hypothetical protein